MMPELGVSDVNQAKSAPLSLHTGKYEFSAAGSLQEIICRVCVHWRAHL